MIQTANLVNLFSGNNLILFMLVFTRLTGVMQTAPFFSSLKAPMMAKVWFCALIAFLMYPLVAKMNHTLIPHDMIEFSIILIIEFSIGYLIGFIANLIIEAVRMAGNTIAIQMGLSMSQALDPNTGVSAPELANIYVYLAILIFLATGAYQILFITVFNSFQSVPVGILPELNGEFISSMLTLFAQLFKISFGVALPIYAVLLISDVLLGLMSKAMPQMNVFMVSIPVKIYIGFILFIVFLDATSVYLKGAIGGYLNAIGILFN